MLQRMFRHRRLATLRLLLLAAFLLSLGLAGPARGQTPAFRVLVFSKTAGFRHDSIPNGIAAIQQLGTANNFAVTTTEDAAQFNAANLAQYQAVIFLSTTGDVLDATQQTAFENYIRSGRGYVGIHSASDTEYSWPWYGQLVGAYFQSHPANQQATVKVADKDHPSTASLPRRWVRTDELYNYQTNPRGTVHVLATLDETTYSPGTGAMGFDHPIAWCRPYDGGRSWYTGLGHTQASYTETNFLNHMLGGIRWAAGNVAGDCSATLNSQFQKVILDDNTVDPMELAVAPDGRVFYAERGGRVRIYKPSTSSTVLAGTISVFSGNEDGLLGITLDPNFATNNWIYLFYSPASGTPRQHVSRFTMSGDTLTLSSEVVLLQIPTQRDECCHSGGSLSFDGTGNLFISLGDNSNPFDSSGYTPIDERSGRSAWDAQKSASNTQDLRGKILRIRPQTNGTYTIPTGNLFTTASAGRPEIYSMGHRNPFRIGVDSATGWLYWGEVGPDASADSATRGPMGHDEFNQAKTAGNYGWPYCIGNNKPYIDFNFATSTSGAAFNCAAPVNNSPNNTGPQSLPAARNAMIWYPYGASAEFPEITNGSGRTAMSGPVYQYNAALSSSRKLPAYYDDTLFIYEWSRNWIKEVKFDESGNLLKINPFVPGFSFVRPMDLEIGPDGAIYMIEWGTGFGGGNADSQLIRIDYITGNRAPTARATGTPNAGSVPLAVSFSSAGSSDPDGNPITYAWDFTSDGTTDSTAANPSFTYTTAGNYTARLTVSDGSATGVANVPIAAGNNRPVVTVAAPPEGSFFDWTEAVSYQASVTDVEDGSTGAGTIPCARVDVRPATGHDDHSHDGTPTTGCSGDIVLPADHGYGNIVYVLSVSYTDNGRPNVAPLTGQTVRILQPKRKEAEFYSSQSGVQAETTGDTLGGGQNIGFIDHNDWISLRPINLQNMTAITYRVASAGVGGTIEVRVDSPTGTLISTANIAVTGGWQTYTNVTAPVTNPGGTHELFFVFKRNAGDTGLFNINWIDFVGDGVSFTPSGGTGTGLNGDYYDNMNFTGTKVTRTDPTVNFNWGSGVPATGIAADTFSVRWTGQVQPQYSQTYTFYTTSDDGVRLWVNGTQIINNWTDHGPTENSGTIALTAGQKYNITMEYYENGGGATATLSWSSSSQPKQIIPQSRLYLPAAPATTIRVNSGGPAVAPFAADASFSGGGTFSTSTAVSTAGVANAAPAAVYQSERYGNHTYTFTGLTAGASYTVRLHFAEIYWTAAGQRVFDVSINGTQVLNDLDIFTAAAGNFKALVRDFTATANASGAIAIQFTTVVDNAKVSGIEILSSGTLGLAAPGTNAPSTSVPSAAAPSTSAPSAAPTVAVGACDHPYYPLRQGRAWTYRTAGLRAQPVEKTLTAPVAGTDVGTQITCADGALQLGSIPRQVEQPRDRTAGFRTVKFEGVYLPPVEQLVPGAQWAAHYTLRGMIEVDGQPVDAIADVTLNFELAGIEPVTVPAGTFSTLKIKQTTSISMRTGAQLTTDPVLDPAINPPVVFEQINWYARGIGLVKTTTPIAMLAQNTTELTRYTR